MCKSQRSASFFSLFFLCKKKEEEETNNKRRARNCFFLACLLCSIIVMWSVSICKVKVTLIYIFMNCILWRVCRRGRAVSQHMSVLPVVMLNQELNVSNRGIFSSFTSQLLQSVWVGLLASLFDFQVSTLNVFWSSYWWCGSGHFIDGALQLFVALQTKPIRHRLDHCYYQPTVASWLGTRHLERPLQLLVLLWNMPQLQLATTRMGLATGGLTLFSGADGDKVVVSSKHNISINGITTTITSKGLDDIVRLVKVYTAENYLHGKHTTPSYILHEYNMNTSQSRGKTITWTWCECGGPTAY